MVVTKRRYTFDVWFDSPANTTLAELVDGIPIERMSTTSDHGSVVKALWRWLDRAEEMGYGTVYLGPVAALLDADSTRRNAREPDVFFLTQDRQYLDAGRAIEGVPDLVIEVLSPTNRGDALPGGEKWRDYERFAVPYYWTVDPDAKTVAQYEHRDGRLQQVALLRPGDTLSSPLLPGITLPVATLFQRLRASGR